MERHIWTSQTASSNLCLSIRSLLSAIQPNHPQFRQSKTLALVMSFFLRTILLGLAFGGTSFAYPAVSDTAPKMKVDGKTLEELAPFIKPAKVIDFPPEIRQTAKRQIIQYGPFEIPALKVRRCASHQMACN